jgi:hypothetical protein
MKLYDDIKAKENKVAEMTKAVKLLNRLSKYAGKRLVDEAQEQEEPRDMQRKLMERKFMIEKVKDLEVKLSQDQ